MFAPDFIYRVKRFIIHSVHVAVKKSDNHENTKQKIYFVFLNVRAFVIISQNSDYNFTHFSSFQAPFQLIRAKEV